MIYFILAYLLMGIVFAEDLAQRKELLRTYCNEIIVDDDLSTTLCIIFCFIMILAAALDIAIWPIEFILSMKARKKSKRTLPID